MPASARSRRRPFVRFHLRRGLTVGCCLQPQAELAASRKVCRECLVLTSWVGAPTGRGSAVTRRGSHGSWLRRGHTDRPPRGWQSVCWALDATARGDRCGRVIAATASKRPLVLRQSRRASAPTRRRRRSRHGVLVGSTSDHRDRRLPSHSLFVRAHGDLRRCRSRFSSPVVHKGLRRRANQRADSGSPC